MAFREGFESSVDDKNQTERSNFGELAGKIRNKTGTFMITMETSDDVQKVVHHKGIVETDFESGEKNKHRFSKRTIIPKYKDLNSIKDLKEERYK